MSTGDLMHVRLYLCVSDEDHHHGGAHGFCPAWWPCCKHSFAGVSLVCLVVVPHMHAHVPMHITRGAKTSSHHWNGRSDAPRASPVHRDPQHRVPVAVILNSCASDSAGCPWHRGDAPTCRVRAPRTDNAHDMYTGPPALALRRNISYSRAGAAMCGVTVIMHGYRDGSWPHLSHAMCRMSRKTNTCCNRGQRTAPDDGRPGGGRDQGLGTRSRHRWRTAGVP